MTTFQQLTDLWLQHKIRSGRSPRTISAMQRTLHNDLWPALGHLDVTTITPLDCLHCIQNIEQRGALAYAKRTRGWLTSILDFGFALGMLTTNPAAGLAAATTPPPKPTPYPHLGMDDIGPFLHTLRADTQHTLTTQTCLWVGLYTAQRPNSLLLAEWSEMDLAKGLWCIPGEHMKSGEPLHCPLPSQALQHLRTLHDQQSAHGYVFSGRGGHTTHLSRHALGRCLHDLGYAGRYVPHGARHQLSTLCHEFTWPESWIEMQIGHVIPGSAGRYNKSQLLGQRATMLQWHADLLGMLEAGGPTPVQRQQLIQRVVQARDTDPVTYADWAATSDAEPSPDTPPTAGRKRTFAPWRHSG
ncbi:tyrosine-type recombinase/integrase [Halomonas cupida]|uniref:tyrosine-type recombinase/integrase n=1 Tax=Halomonas cupida TaxID=44933 RepID=UPI003A914A77